MRDPASMAAICLLVYPLWVPMDWSDVKDHILPLEKNCVSATDGCRVCKIDEGRVIGCSFPGIACTRGDRQCNEWSKETPSNETPQSQPPVDDR